jgi:hypothetical protein
MTEGEVMAGLSIIPLLFAGFLCFLGGLRCRTGKWLRYVLSAIFFALLGWLMGVSVGYLWGYKATQEYYEEILRMVAPSPPLLAHLSARRGTDKI